MSEENAARKAATSAACKAVAARALEMRAVMDNPVVTRPGARVEVLDALVDAQTDLIKALNDECWQLDRDNTAHKAEIDELKRRIVKIKFGGGED